MSVADAVEPVVTGGVGYAFAALLGLVFGSFANVCIYRLPEGRSVATPGSHCGACGEPVRWYDNLPVLSYLLLRGHCRFCKADFSPRYLLVELATGLLFAALFASCVTIPYDVAPLPVRLGRFGVYAAFAFVLVVIAFIDLDHKLILDKVTFPSIVLFYGLGLTLPERTWPEGLIGIAVGYGVVRLIADGYRLLTGRDGMGYGDGKLLALVGALFGWKAVVFSLFGGSLLGTLIAVPLLLAQRRGVPHPVAVGEGVSVDHAAAATGDADAPAPEGEADLRHVEVPFGPFLAAAALVYAVLDGAVPLTFDRLLAGPGLL